MKESFIVLIPAYQPEENLVRLVQQFKLEGCDVIVVNDGSSPDRSAVFKAAGESAVVLTHPENRGKGAALKTGFRYILENVEDPAAIVTVDADGQHRIEDALLLLKRSALCPGTLFLGSRKLEGKVPLRSRLGNTVTRLVYRLSTGVKVYDTQTGLRAFSSDLLPRMLEIDGERYEYEMNMLLSCARDHIPIREEWIETIYLDNNASSHFNAVRDSFRIYKEILKFSASSFAGFVTDYLIYSLLIFLGGGLLLSNISARIVSSALNYTINRKLVFKSKAGILRSALSYFLLAALILAGNTVVLSLLADILGVNAFLAKVVTEVLFFTISWTVQKFVIFRRSKDDENKISCTVQSALK